MDNTEFMVYWIDIPGGMHATPTCDMNEALKIANRMRHANMRFVTIASESVANVGKLGVDSVIDGKCPDGGDFLGRTSRHGMAMKKGAV